MSAAHKARLMADPRFGGWAAGQQCPQDAPERPRSAQNAPEAPAQLPGQTNAAALDFGPGLETQVDPVAAAACKARAAFTPEHTELRRVAAVRALEIHKATGRHLTPVELAEARHWAAKAPLKRPMGTGETP